MARIASIGECMVELVEAGPSLLRQGYGGDTLNTAVYLRRALPAAAGSVAYVTGLGNDAFSDEMVAGWQAEGLDCSQVARLEGRLPGLYVIKTDEKGERSFLYWRSTAAARDVFANAEGEARLQGLAAFDLVYLSGISLAILTETDRARLLDVLAERRRQGAMTAFDPNYRPRLWADTDAARRVMAKAARTATMVLPSFADERDLFGDATPEATLDRLHAEGAEEVIVKNGDAPIHFRMNGEAYTTLPVQVSDAVDTTGAGDSFNGAYLAARIQGRSIARAVDAATRLSATVVRYQGAIIPRDAALF